MHHSKHSRSYQRERLCIDDKIARFDNARGGKSFVENANFLRSTSATITGYQWTRDQRRIDFFVYKETEFIEIQHYWFIDSFYLPDCGLLSFFNRFLMRRNYSMNNFITLQNESVFLHKINFSHHKDDGNEKSSLPLSLTSHFPQMKKFHRQCQFFFFCKSVFQQSAFRLGSNVNDFFPRRIIQRHCEKKKTREERRIRERSGDHRQRMWGHPRAQHKETAVLEFRGDCETRLLRRQNGMENDEEAWEKRVQLTNPWPMESSRSSFLSLPYGRFSSESNEFIIVLRRVRYSFL